MRVPERTPRDLCLAEGLRRYWSGQRPMWSSRIWAWRIHPYFAFCTVRIISSAQIHPYLALLCCRDDFFQPDSSPAWSFVPKGWFLPPRFILILLFCAVGIISSAQTHLFPENCGQWIRSQLSTTFGSTFSIPSVWKISQRNFLWTARTFLQNLKKNQAFAFIRFL